ncbi:MAG TPA: LPP20 family lipoprotein [Gallionellaceae bacterium]|nr:LPP20 family lipoprotein [Gallionellaceae bacterium]
MKLILSIVFASVALLLGGCATKSTQPDWVAGDSAKYAKSEYLFGRGSASSVEDAKKRALADLSEIFQVSIAVNSEDVQSYKKNSKAPDSEQFSAESTRRISTTSDQIIRGIQVAEIWQDPVRKDYHVLAVLQRQQAAAALRQQMDQLDDAVQASIDQSKNSTDLFVKIAAASKAIDTQLEREGLQKTLQVVSASGRGLDSNYNSGRLKADLDDLLKRVRVAPKVVEGSTPGLEQVVAGALSKAGFMIDTGENPDFLLTASLALTDLGLKEGWYWQRGNLEITLTEAATGRVRGTQRWPIKSSATDKGTAIRRALDEADAVLKKELGATIIGMATSQ